MKWNNNLIFEIVHDVYNDINLNIISSEHVIDDILHQIFEQRGKGIPPVFMSLIGELV